MRGDVTINEGGAPFWPMDHAWRAAQRAGRLAEVPVGAVLVHDRRIIAISHNRMRAWKNPWAHAEILVLLQGMKKMNSSYLQTCHLYVTLQPCALCYEAMDKVRIGRLIFGAYDTSPPPQHRAFDSVGGVQEQRCSELLHDFFYPKRDALTPEDWDEYEKKAGCCEESL